MWRSAYLLGLLQLSELFWTDKPIVGDSSHALIDLGDSQCLVHPLRLVGRCFVVHERGSHIRGTRPIPLGAQRQRALSGCRRLTAVAPSSSRSRSRGADATTCFIADVAPNTLRPRHRHQPESAVRSRRKRCPLAFYSSNQRLGGTRTPLFRHAECDVDGSEHVDGFVTNFDVTKREHCDLNRSHPELVRTQQHRCVLHIFEGQRRRFGLDCRFVKTNYRRFIIHREKRFARPDDGVLVVEGKGRADITP